MVDELITQTRINKSILNEIKAYIEENKVNYPSILFFVNQACKDKLGALKLIKETKEEEIKNER